MPTVLRIDGLRVAIYPNDHSPAHVHVIGPGVGRGGCSGRPADTEAIGCSEPDARRVLGLISEHQAALMEDWRRFHG